MKVDKAWNVLGILEAVSCTLFTILFIALFGGAFVPISGSFVSDMILWFAITVGLAAVYIRAAHLYRRRLAERKGETIEMLSTLHDVSYEILGFLGGGFFGILLASVAWSEYEKAGGFSEGVALMAGLATIGVGACCTSLVKFWRCQHANTEMELPDPPGMT